MRLGFMVLAASLGFGLAASAETVHYNCKMQHVPNPGYLSEAMSLAVDLDAWTAKVEYSVAKKAIGKAASATVEAQNDLRFTLSWPLVNLPVDPTEVGNLRVYKHYYRMSVFSDGRAKIDVASNFYLVTKSYATVGTCARAKK
jgi:hypothetical protein